MRRRSLPRRLVATLALAALALPEAAWAGRRVMIADGTAEPVTQATAAAMALFPVVAVLVFALARLIDPPQE